MVFNTSGWHIKSNEQFSQLDGIMSFLHLWRMPLLFLISGAGTYYAVKRRTSREYLKERFFRLVIPLVSGVFILVPVQVYIERINQYESLIDFYPNMFNGIYPHGNFSWHHLWFIAYLFLISVIVTPFLHHMKRWVKHSVSNRFVNILSTPGGLNILIIALLVSQLLLKPHFPDETHDVVNDWAFIAYNLLFFLSGFFLFVNEKILCSIKKYRWFYTLEAMIAAVCWFFAGNIKEVSFIIQELLNATITWSASIVVIAWSAVMLNKNLPVRKLANEAIYPFYLLHQPLIIICSFFVLPFNIPLITKGFIIAILSFATSIGICWFVIRPYNFTRLLFGMKRRKSPRLLMK
jgi:hypothetical protein